MNNGGSVSITATAIDTLYQLHRRRPCPPASYLEHYQSGGGALRQHHQHHRKQQRDRPDQSLAAPLSPLPAPRQPAISGCRDRTHPFHLKLSPASPSTPATECCPTRPRAMAQFRSMSSPLLPRNCPPITAWVATTDCQNASGCSSALFSMAPRQPEPIPSARSLSLPRTPNSLVFNHQSSPRLYIGSDQGLMYVDVASTSAATNSQLGANPRLQCPRTLQRLALCGTVLTTSNDGKFAVISDPPTASTPSQVYIFDGGANPLPTVQLTLDNPDFPGEFATAASFSPDQLKLFILTNAGNMYVYSTVDTFAQVPSISGTGPTFTTPATDVQFSADGSFAYVAGAPASSISAYSTCSVPGAASVNIGTVATSNPPLKVFPSPMLPPFQPGSDAITQNVFALEVPPATSNQSTSLQVLTANFTQDPIGFVPNQPLQFTCNPPTVPPSIPPTPLNHISLTPGATINLGQGNFTPLFSQLVGERHRAHPGRPKHFRRTRVQRKQWNHHFRPARQHAAPASPPPPPPTAPRSMSPPAINILITSDPALHRWDSAHR